ncbi:MAG: hypothetical protein QXG65_02600 [Thermoplasmata archaeon]
MRPRRDAPPEGAGLAARVGWRPLALLVAVLVVLGAQDTVAGPVAGIAIAVAGIAAAAIVRLGSRGLGSVAFPVPAGIALAVVAVGTPVTVVGEVLAGVAALALLLWCADGPDASPGSARRSADLIALPALGLFIAVGSGILLPPGNLQIGLAALLLTATILLVIATIARWVFPPVAGSPQRPPSVR